MFDSTWCQAREMMLATAPRLLPPNGPAIQVTLPDQATATDTPPVAESHIPPRLAPLDACATALNTSAAAAAPANLGQADWALFPLPGSGSARGQDAAVLASTSQQPVHILGASETPDAAGCAPTACCYADGPDQGSAAEDSAAASQRLAEGAVTESADGGLRCERRYALRTEPLVRTAPSECGRPPGCLRHTLTQLCGHH